MEVVAAILTLVTLSYVVGWLVGAVVAFVFWVLAVISDKIT